MKWQYWTLKYLWQERARTWMAYRRFRRYGYFYRRDCQLSKLYGRRPRSNVGMACSYVLNNSPSFDGTYFPDMERDFDSKLKQVQASR